jgi:acyl-CoA dehydrogenase
LRRFEAEGCLKSDEVILKVAMEEGFRRIDEAFEGIHRNLSSGLPGMLFRLKGYWGRINPMGTAVNDRDLHNVAMQLSTDETFRNRICSNMYRGGRVEELNEAAKIMLEAQEAIRQRKKTGADALDEAAKKLLEKADRSQERIIAVDSYTTEEYFKC